MIDQSSFQSIYPTKSALKNYYLESTLPAYVINKQYNIKPLPKTHQFYKNDTFIWNNPYRSSRKNYKYFHQQQQQFKPLEEKIRKQTIQDNQKIDSQRIKLLKSLREEDRKRIKTRKDERERLESEVYGDSRIQTLQSNGSIYRSFRKKQKTCGTQEKETVASSVDIAAKKIIQSTILKERQSRLQQLRNRKAQIQELVKRSGQTMKMSRPLTAVRKSHQRMLL